MPDLHLSMSFTPPRGVTSVCRIAGIALILLCTACAAATPAAPSPVPASPTPPPPVPTSPPATTATQAPVAATPSPAVPTVPTSPPQAKQGWSQIAAANSGPAARYDHSIVFDPARQRLVVFGGRGDGIYGDTWIFDSATRLWRSVTGSAPSARFGHAAVYDAANDRMLVVMGQAGPTFFNDVWAFDLGKETWTQLVESSVSADKPRIRYGQSAALDGKGRVLISHGFSDQGRFDDTWAFDPSAGKWVNITPAGGPKPLKRCLHELAYDAANDRLLLFGGCSSGFGPCPQGDFWSLDLKSGAWSELKPAGPAPSARSNPSMVYDATGRRAFLFGGKTNGGGSAETWIYESAANRWLRVEEAGPAARSSQYGAFDSKTGRIIIFGGLISGGRSAEIWEFRF